MNISNILKQKYHVRISSFTKQLIQKEKSLKVKKEILRQYLPSKLELFEHPNFIEDPLYEDTKNINPLKNVLHKYPNTVLILTTEICPVYCRFCTRKRKTLQGQYLSVENINEIYQYILDKNNITEVILSGGDPFMLKVSLLEMILNKISSIPHVKFIRIHTKTIVNSPKRLTKIFSLLNKVIKKSGITYTIVVHINHPKEISQEFILYTKKLHKLGVKIYSQSVLLKKVNDSISTLKNLFINLSLHGIQPYYLHHLDRIQGSSHFYIEEVEGIKLFKEVKKEVPHHILPRYVKDSQEGKINLCY